MYIHILYIYLLVKFMPNAQHAPISSLNCTILLVGLPKRERETERITIFAHALCSALSLHHSYIQCDNDNQLLPIVLNNSHIN